METTQITTSKCSRYIGGLLANVMLGIEPITSAGYPIYSQLLHYYLAEESEDFLDYLAQHGVNALIGYVSATLSDKESMTITVPKEDCWDYANALWDYMREDEKQWITQQITIAQRLIKHAPSQK